MAGTLSIVALGDVRRALLEAAAAGAAGIFELDTALDLPLAEPKYAYNPSRQQHHAASILRKLGQNHIKANRAAVLAITDVDLFEPETDFVLGDGDRDLRACVISLKRLRDGCDEDKLARRVRLLGAWAVGLAIGLRDCDDSRCAMSAPSTGEGLDRRTGLLCNGCRATLAKGL